MILSKVILLPGRLDNAWEWHRTIWTLFPSIERQPNEPAPFLYRMERMNLAQGAEVLVQSERSPLEKSDSARVLAARSIDPKPQTGQQLHFLLTANVTKVIRDKEQPERKIRVPLIREDEQIAWLKRKLGNAAGAVTSLHVQPHSPTYFRKGNRPGKIVTTSFEGILTVDNPQTLSNLLTTGIGPAKAFGCGLMLVRRI